jgi:hypothetical protein
MAPQILTANERLAEPYGPKIVLFGPSGVGKTSLLKTIFSADLHRWLFVDIEGGGLAIAGLEVASIRPETWRDCNNIAAVLGGPNPALPSSAFYSPAHHESATADPTLAGLAAYDCLFVDSITATARLSFTAAEQLPEAMNERGRKDVRAVYGAHGRSMLGWLNQLQRARRKTVVMVGILEDIRNDANLVVGWQPQLEGLKTGRELPGIVDELITYQWVKFGGDGKPTRSLVCVSPNAWSYPAKDRSGKLDTFEEPHLGKLLAKLLARPTPDPAPQEKGED